MPQSGDVLERFIETLVQEITVNRPQYLTSPFTVAEIYQDLVPYRSHRASIGVEMNADYEEALLQMLSGEGDCLVLDSAVARQEMQEELASPNPNTSLFHDFAAADVRLHPGRVPVDAGLGSEVVAAEISVTDTIDPAMAPTAGVDVELEAETELEAGKELEAEEVPPRAAAVGGTGPADATPPPDGGDQVELLKADSERSDEDGVVGHIETVSASPAASLPATVEEPEPDGDVSVDGESDDVLTVCHWCRETLPVRDSVHFCPFCGSDLRPSPCRECGSAMEARWHFCVSCGANVRD